MKEENRLKKEHVDIQFLSLSVSILAFLILAYFAGNIYWIKDFQSFITLISGVFAIFIGIIALLRYYTKRSSFNFLFIGIGFIGVGLLDVFQIVIDLGAFNNLFSTSSGIVYPMTSVLSKSFLAVLMFLSWFVSRNEHRDRAKKKKEEYLLMAIVAVSFVSFVGVFVYLLLNGVEVDSFAVVVIGLLSLMLLILSLIGYLFNKGWQYDDFNYWVIFALSFLILSQIFYLPFFNLEYTNMINLSVWARFFAYLGLLTGFLNSIYVLFENERKSQKELELKNKQLDAAKEQIEEAYLIIRKEKWDLARSNGTVVDKILKDVVKSR